MVVEVGAWTLANRRRGSRPPSSGSLYHRTLEIAARDAEGSEDVRQGVLENLEAAFEEAELELELGRVRGWVHWREVYLAQLERAVRAEDFALPGAEVAQTEARFAGEWQGFEVVGRVDRVDRTPEGLVFVDYKSTASAPNPDLQLSVYREAAAAALFPGEPVRDAYYYSLRKAERIKAKEPTAEALGELAEGMRDSPRGGSPAARRAAAGLRLLRVRSGLPPGPAAGPQGDGGSGLTGEQRRAVGAEGSVVVVAGAGTGKTHMLTERYVHHLSEDGLSPLEVVAVTFTEKAAEELRSRVRERVRGRLADREDLLAELEAAQISTIHALCARVCREHPDEAGVPADFGILDELRGRLWTADRLADAMDDLPEEHYRVVPYPLMQAALEALLSDPLAAEEALAKGPEGWRDLIEEARESAASGVSRRTRPERGALELRVVRGGRRGPHGGVPACSALRARRSGGRRGTARARSSPWRASICAAARRERGAKESSRASRRR